MICPACDKHPITSSGRDFFQGSNSIENGSPFMHETSVYKESLFLLFNWGWKYFSLLIPTSKLVYDGASFWSLVNKLAFKTTISGYVTKNFEMKIKHYCFKIFRFLQRFTANFSIILFISYSSKVEYRGRRSVFQTEHRISLTQWTPNKKDPRIRKISKF